MRKTIAVLLILGFCLPLVAVPMPNTLKGYMKLFKPGMTKTQVQKITAGWGLVDVTDRFRKKDWFGQFTRGRESYQGFQMFKFVSLYNTRFFFFLSFDEMDYLRKYAFLILGKPNATLLSFKEMKDKIQRDLKKSPNDVEKTFIGWKCFNRKIGLFYGVTRKPILVVIVG